MFRKILVACRGTMAVRVMRACWDLKVKTVAVYQGPDRTSLHVRVADQGVELKSDAAYEDAQLMVQIALEHGAEAIHPGCGPLAEKPELALACERAGLKLIGPPAAVLAGLQDRPAMLQRARMAGLRVLDPALAQAMSVQPHRQITVQVLADRLGTVVNLGDRDGSLQFRGRKLVEESPSPALDAEQRASVLRQASAIARIFHYLNTASIQFVIDQKGEIFFSGIRPCLTLEHAASEMVTRIDIVRQQLRIAAGEPLSVKQEDATPHGCAIQCHLQAEDPWNNLSPAPGSLVCVRLPGGSNVRLDTYIHAECHVPALQDPTLGVLTVWAENRDDCVRKLRGALKEFSISGLPTNLPLHQRILNHPEFISGQYRPDFVDCALQGACGDDANLRDTAVATALLFARRKNGKQPSTPDRLRSGWHRLSRRLPSTMRDQ